MPETRPAESVPKEPVRPAGASSVLPYGRQWLDDEDIAAVVDVLRGDWMTQGPAIPAFESALAELCGARYAVAVANGTAALHIATLAAGIKPGDVGVTSPITFVASANCIAYCGGTPAFVDVDPDTITMDPEALAAFCERRPPKLVIPVDFTGQAADLPAIAEIAQRSGALVIEDAAHSLGGSYRHDGKWYRCGSCAHSDMAILSFHPVKHVTTGEGGAVLTNDAALYKRLCDLRTHGIHKDPERLTRQDGPWYYEQSELGYNYRITDFQCALGLSQLKKLERFVDRRRELVDLYRDALHDLEEDVRLLIEAPDNRSSYHLMVARIGGGAAARRRVFEGLQAQGIRAQVHYIPVHLQPWYRRQLGFAPGDFPVAEAFYDSCISLPLFPAMSDADVGRVARALGSLLRRT